MGWMLVALLLLTGVTAVGGLAWWLGRGMWRMVRSWRMRAPVATPVPERALTAWELGIPVDADMAWRLMVADGRDFYGSMDRDAELGLLPAPEVAHSGWWGQMEADLAPEALGEEVMPAEHSAALTELRLQAVPSAHVSTGPGADSSLAPGPDFGAPYGWGGDPADPEPLPPPRLELGPNAARVLARWEERRRERWRLDWDNGAVAA